nr:hypothetical protein [Tanacetum cinerariifolium]
MEIKPLPDGQPIPNPELIGNPGVELGKGMGTRNPRIMKSGMGRGEKSLNLCGNLRSPLGTGMGKKNDSPTRIWMGMGMRVINGNMDVFSGCLTDGEVIVVGIGWRNGGRGC